MNDYLVLKCFTVVLLAQQTLAINSYELRQLMNKIDNLKTTIETSLKEIEQASKERHANLQDQLTRHEQDVKKRFEKLDTKMEMKMYATEESLKKSVETYEDNTRAKLEDLKNQLVFKMDNILQQQVAETKIYRETSEFKLKKIGENQNSIYMLTDSVRNMSTLSEKNNKILEAHFKYPVRSCRHVFLSGRYVIHVGLNFQPFEVLCEQTKFEGGWTVIQQRFDGSVDFYRGWTEHRNGFGSLNGEFWLGLEYVHQMTKNQPHELLVEVKDFQGKYGYAKYEEFEIGSESEKYVLKKLGIYSGTAGDSMRHNKDEKFSTFDRDNDQSDNNCAEQRHGAWWYFTCSYTYSNLNGHYQNTADDIRAMSWYHLKNEWRGLSYSRMMIRATNIQYNHDKID